MNLVVMKSTKYLSAVLMTKDIYIKMEKQAMHTDIKILKFNCNFFIY